MAVCAADDVILRELLLEGKQLEYADSPDYRQLYKSLFTYLFSTV